MKSLGFSLGLRKEESEMSEDEKIIAQGSYELKLILTNSYISREDILDPVKT
jgi:hypothetical protein